MRRFFTVASAVTAVTLVVVGCGSDSTSGGTSTGGTGGSSTGGSSTGGSSTGGSGGSTADGTCTAPQYADVTLIDFLSQAADKAKACAGDTDASNICSNDVSKAGANCGKSCLAAGDDAAQATCVEACINQNLPSGATPLSDSCLKCYSANVQCSKMNCLAPCLASPTGQDCAQCRVQKGCSSAFYDCSGLPVPTGLDLGPSSSAGAGGA